MHRPFLVLTRHPLPTALVVCCLTALAILGVTRIQFDDDFLNTIRTDDDQWATLERTYEEFGYEVSECVVVVEADNILSRENLALVRRLERALRDVEGVEFVTSLHQARRPRRLGRFLQPMFPVDDAPDDHFERARHEAMAHPMLVNHLLSENAQSTLILVRLAGNNVPLDQVEATLDNMRTAMGNEAAGTDVRIRVTGPPPIRSEIVRGLFRSQFIFNGLGFALASVIAWILFRKPAAVIVAGLPPVLGLMWTMGLLGLIGERINIVNSSISPLLLAIGLTDAIHLLFHMRRQRGLGLDPIAAAQSAIADLTLPCALTSVTTAVGFGSLSIAEVDIVQRFGLACAAGTLMTFLAVVTVMPLLMRTPLGAHVGFVDPGTAHTPSRKGVRLIRPLLDRPRAAIAVGVLCCIGLAISGLQLRPNYQSTDHLPRNNDAYGALQFLEEEYGGILSTHVVARWPPELSLDSPAVLQVLGSVHDILENEPIAATPLSVLDLFASLPDTEPPAESHAAWLDRFPESFVNGFVRRDLHAARVVARVRDQGARANAPGLARIEEALRTVESAHPGFELRQTGLLSQWARNVNRLTADLLRSLTLATVIIFCVITASLRSIRLGIISLLPNALPIFGGAAILVWLGLYLEVTGVVVFSIGLGIAVDDTIHMLTRFQRELASTGDPDAAAEHAFTHMAPVLVTTTLVLGAGFGVLLVSEFAPVRLFGWLACWILLLALVSDLFLLPPFLKVLGASRTTGTTAR